MNEEDRQALSGSIAKRWGVQAPFDLITQLIEQNKRKLKENSKKQVTIDAENGTVEAVEARAATIHY